MESIIIPLIGIILVEGYYLYEFAKQNKHLVKGYNNLLDNQKDRYSKALDKIDDLTKDVKQLEKELKRICHEK